MLFSYSFFFFSNSFLTSSFALSSFWRLSIKLFIELILFVISDSCSSFDLSIRFFSSSNCLSCFNNSLIFSVNEEQLSSTCFFFVNNSSLCFSNSESFLFTSVISFSFCAIISFISFSVWLNFSFVWVKLLSNSSFSCCILLNWLKISFTFSLNCVFSWIFWYFSFSNVSFSLFSSSLWFSKLCTWELKFFSLTSYSTVFFSKFIFSIVSLCNSLLRRYSLSSLLFSICLCVSFIWFDISMCLRSSSSLCFAIFSFSSFNPFIAVDIFSICSFFSTINPFISSCAFVSFILLSFKEEFKFSFSVCIFNFCTKASSNLLFSSWLFSSTSRTFCSISFFILFVSNNSFCILLICSFFSFTIFAFVISASFNFFSNSFFSFSYLSLSLILSSISFFNFTISPFSLMISFLSDVFCFVKSSIFAFFEFSSFSLFFNSMNDTREEDPVFSIGRSKIFFDVLLRKLPMLDKSFSYRSNKASTFTFTFDICI